VSPKPSPPSLRSLRTDLHLVRDAGGHVTQAVGTCTDTATGEEMGILGTSLAEATTQVEHFMAFASHDLRTPMRNARSLSDMLRDGFQDRGDGKVDLINLPDEVAAKSAGMIIDVLAYSQSVVAAPETLTFAVDDLYRAIGRLIDPRGHHDLVAPRMVLRADRLAVQIILRNLIDTALKHGGKDRMSITITLAEAEPGFIRLAVTDDGVGFSNPGKVFLEGGAYRADCGCGLMGIRRLLTARGGRMEIDQRERAALVTLPGQIVAPVTAPRYQAESTVSQARKGA
jgi:signal transduction histidine kinase